MATIDKNQAVIDFLVGCPTIQDNPLFFNFSKEEDNNKSVITESNDKAVTKPYIDGSVLRRYTFTIIDYKSVAHNAIIKQAGYSNENVEDIKDLQDIIDWINLQADARIFPNFGEDCEMDKMYTTTDNPEFNGVDNVVAPQLVRYSVTIVIEYIDNSKRIY